MPDPARPTLSGDASPLPMRGAAHEVAREICARHGDDPAALIEILHDLQAAEGHVAPEAVPEIARALNLGRAEVHGVLTFYHDFRQAPEGRVELQLCRGESCQAMGAEALIAAVCARRGAALGETAGDGVTIKPVYCLGNCALAPAARVDGRLVGRASPERLDSALDAALSEPAR